ncbi:hypothetical protein [Brevundimonas sp.]|uniref:hypothetical protein n=1 Tax=Brevundimonas sp. TaxID=1871086 RepID=UPI0035629152
MFSAVVIALTLATATATANVSWQSQDPPALPQEPPATQLEDVVVEGRGLRDAVDDFVDEIVAPPVGRGPARWNRRVCVGVVNFRREAAQALVDQVSSVALQAGLEIGDPGCSPNILIIATDDAQGLARGLVARNPLVFRPQYSGAARSSEALKRFQETGVPVRWWHVSMPTVRGTGLPGVRMPGESPPRIPGEGRLRSPLQNDLLKAFIIIDVNAAAGVDLRRLGDYVGMVALAQIDPEADASSYDTILNLFDTPQPPLALTEWDTSYLAALYGAELNQRPVNFQAGEISSSMFRDRRAAQQAEQPDEDE